MSIIGKINDFKIKLSNVSSYKQYGADEVLEFINSFPEPKNNDERSYYQYKCNSKLYGVNAITTVGRNIGCFFPFLFLMLRKGHTKQEAKKDYVFISDEHKMDIMPLKYKKSMVQVSRSQGWLLRKQERKAIYRLWKKHPFSFYFLLKNLIKIANYRWAIDTYSPQAILCSCEYSFTSSFLTEYCRSMKLKHINIMHGYNMVDLKCPFSTFDIMSIWDRFFVDAFKKMRNGTAQFEVDKPSCVTIKKIDIHNEIPILVYYTQNYVKKAVPILMKLKELANKNEFRLKIRCHPSYPFDEEDIKRLGEDSFENTKDVSIELSINSADYIVARNSTVLYQAAQIDKRILIDDITLPDEYLESRKKGAFLWETNNTELLSTFIKKCDNGNN